MTSEFVLRRVFDTFGDVRCVDVPVCDEYRAQMTKTGMRTTGFSFGQHLTFEAYVQFVEYISFVKCMDALRAMKLVHIGQDGKPTATAIKVSKHMLENFNCVPLFLYLCSTLFVVWQAQTYNIIHSG